MTMMFQLCEVFKSDLSSWDVSNVKYKDNMFRGCRDMEANPELQPKFS